MHSKIMSVLLLFIVAIGFSGLASAADTVTLNGLAPGQGEVQQYTHSNGTPMKGLCVDKNHTIYIGSTHPITKGTDQIPNNNEIKKLIVQNYRDGMTAQQGNDLQDAIWVISDGITVSNPQVQAMLDAAAASDIQVSDNDYQQVISSETVQTGHTVTETIEPVGQDVTSVSTTLPNGKDVSTLVVKDEKGTTTTTTTVEHFITTTVDDIVSHFVKTTTVVDTFHTVQQTLRFNFDSLIDGATQKIMLFTAVPDVVEFDSGMGFTEQNPIDIPSNVTTSVPYDVTNIVSNFVPAPVKPVPPVTPVKPVVKPVVPVVKHVEPNTIPMQHTGGDVLPLIIALLAIAGAVGYVLIRRE